jgi:hypothetical protein
MSRSLASVSLAMLVLTVAMGLRTVVTSHGDGFFVMANGLAPAPTLSIKNGPDPLPAPWKRNGPDPLPAPWKGRSR